MRFYLNLFFDPFLVIAFFFFISMFSSNLQGYSRMPENIEINENTVVDT